MELDFANPMYAFACIRLIRKSYRLYSFVLVMTSPVAVGSKFQLCSQSL